MEFKEKLQQKLLDALQPETLKLVDESARHRGHAGYQPGGNSHFRLRIVADAFMGQTRLARHRTIHTLLAEELRTQIHALAIDALTPDEAKKSQG